MLTPRTLAPALILLLLAAGCGSSDKPRASSTSTPTATSTPVATPSAALTASPAPAASERASRSPQPDQDPLSPAPAVEKPAPPLGQPRCRPELMRVDDADSIDQAGRVLEVFVLRTAQAACQIQGYPALRFVDSSGRRLATQIVHEGIAKPVTLSPTATASFQVAWRRDPSCRQASSVLVTLPGARRPLRTKTGMRVCAATGLSPFGRLVETEGTPE